VPRSSQTVKNGVQSMYGTICDSSTSQIWRAPRNSGCGGA
jgi:hypothetical protein